jgi:hypothetical protein
MITLNYVIKELELSIAELKTAPMLGKPKIAERCVSDILTCVKHINATQKEKSIAVLDLHRRIQALESKKALETVGGIAWQTQQ